MESAVFSVSCILIDHFLQQALRSFKLTITVDPKYHPKIIGRKGAIITQIRTDHDVNIQFPEKNDENQVMFDSNCTCGVGLFEDFFFLKNILKIYVVHDFAIFDLLCLGPDQHHRL